MGKYEVVSVGGRETTSPTEPEVAADSALPVRRVLTRKRHPVLLK